MGELVERGKYYAVDTWCQLLTSVTGLRAIRAKQHSNAPRPDDMEFATVNVFSLNRSGYPDISISQAGATLTETVSNLYLYTASINFYRRAESSPADYIREVEMYLHTSEANEFLLDRGIGVGGVSPGRDLSAITRGKWEERMQVDIVFSMSEKYISTMPQMDSAAVSGTIEVDGSTTYVL